MNDRDLGLFVFKYDGDLMFRIGEEKQFSSLLDSYPDFPLTHAAKALYKMSSLDINTVVAGYNEFKQVVSTCDNQQEWIELYSAFKRLITDRAKYTFDHFSTNVPTHDPYDFNENAFKDAEEMHKIMLDAQKSLFMNVTGALDVSLKLAEYLKNAFIHDLREGGLKDEAKIDTLPQEKIIGYAKRFRYYCQLITDTFNLYQYGDAKEGIRNYFAMCYRYGCACCNSAPVSKVGDMTEKEISDQLLPVKNNLDGLKEKFDGLVANYDNMIAEESKSYDDMLNMRDKIYWANHPAELKELNKHIADYEAQLAQYKDVLRDDFTGKENEKAFYQTDIYKRYVKTGNDKEECYKKLESLGFFKFKEKSETKKQYEALCKEYEEARQAYVEPWNNVRQADEDAKQKREKGLKLEKELAPQIKKMKEEIEHAKFDGWYDNSVYWKYFYVNFKRYIITDPID